MSLLHDNISSGTFKRMGLTCSTKPSHTSMDITVLGATVLKGVLLSLRFADSWEFWGGTPTNQILIAHTKDKLSLQDPRNQFKQV